MEKIDEKSYVVGKVVQGVNVTLNINILESDILNIEKSTICSPRKNMTEKVEKNPLNLPFEILTKITEKEDLLLKWIGISGKNKEIFLLSPVDAIKKAGIKLTKKDLKTLENLRFDLGAHSLIAHGVNLKVVNLTTCEKADKDDNNLNNDKKKQ